MVKDKTIKIRLRQEDKTEIERLAKIMDISAAELIRRAVIGLAKKNTLYQSTKKPVNTPRIGT